MNKAESEFKYLYLGSHDCCFSSDEPFADPLLIYRFLLELAMYEFGYSHCSNKDCVCQPAYKIKQLLKNETILNYVRFTDFYYGNGESIMLKMKELGWIEKGENNGKNKKNSV